MYDQNGQCQKPGTDRKLNKKGGAFKNKPFGYHFSVIIFQIPVKELVKQQLQDTSGLSARERNKAKRKAKLWAKQISRDSQGQR